MEARLEKAQRIMRSPIDVLTEEEQTMRLLAQVSLMEELGEEYHKATGSEVIPIDSEEGQLIEKVVGRIKGDLPHYKNKETREFVQQLINELEEEAYHTEEGQP